MKGESDDALRQRNPASGRGLWRHQDQLIGLGIALAAELIGTAVLVGVGLSFVILDFGLGNPVGPWLPSAAARRALTGFLFGCTGALIAISPVGKHSGAHINPIVTLTFVLTRTLSA